MNTKASNADFTAGSFHGRLAARDHARRESTKRLATIATVATSPRNDLLPDTRLIERDPRSLRRPERNIRAVSAAHVRAVANSISTLGFSIPVLIDENDEILDGVIRTEAAKLLNLPGIPCVQVGHLSSSEKALLRSASNRLTEKGTWDLDALYIVFRQLVIDDAPLEISGFDLVEIDGILSDAEPAIVEQGPLASDRTRNATARAGDVFQLGSHRVVCGDALDARTVYRVMNGASAGLVFTDVPYNVRIVGNVTRGALNSSQHREFAMASGEMTDDEFRIFNESWMRNAFGYLIDGGILATFIDWRGIVTVSEAAEAAGLSQINLVVWAKTNAGMGSLYRSQHELLPLFKKGTGRSANNVQLGKTGRSRSNLWTYPGASTMGSDARRGLQDHPTVKPVAMLSDALLDLTDRGDVVLDCFLGSASTLIAAEKVGRMCRGIELDPLYVDVIVRRYEEVTGQRAILEETGETFAALEARRSSEALLSARVLPTANLELQEPVDERGTAQAPPLIFRKRTRVPPPAPGL